MPIDRREPIEPMPLKRGLCDWCGNKAGHGRSYCSPECRTKYNNKLAAQGKSVMQLLKIWRKHRGRKGTPGEGKLGDVTHRIDEILREDRQRQKDLRRTE